MNLPNSHDKIPLSVASKALHPVVAVHHILCMGMHIFLAAIGMLELHQLHRILSEPINKIL